MKGQIIGGDAGEIRIRQKSAEQLELGELLVCEKDALLLQVFDLQFASQLSHQNLELASGMHLEGETDATFFDEHLRNYTIALAKPLLDLKGVKSAKGLPAFFSQVRDVTKSDMQFLEHPTAGLRLGNLRSGSKELDIPIVLPGASMLSHHILVSGSTGRGKSVLMKNLLWDTLSKEYCGMLVLDPHDEYFGKDGVGLKDHPKKERLIYYGTKGVPAGQRTLKINLSLLRPDHLSFLGFTDAQTQLLQWYYRKQGKQWIQSLFTTTDDFGKQQEFQEVTLSVVRRKLRLILDLDVVDGKVFCQGVFDLSAGESTIRDVLAEIKNGHLVIIDTSLFSSQTELLIGSLVANEVLSSYRKAKLDGFLEKLPVASIVLEEAPRVLGKEILEKGSNVFASIAREGRKFKVGLVGITQLPSLIPKEILANMNTKIILGTEMMQERQALVESAAQDLSKDHRAIASLDKGEAIVTSTFARFAIPLAIPFFDDEVKKLKRKRTKGY